MKKLIALTVCLLMFAGVAMAGTMPLEVKELNNGKTLVVALPEGVTSAEINTFEDLQLVDFELEDEAMPFYMMAVSYSEILHEKSLSDLNDDEIKMLVAYTAADSETHEYEVEEMEDGWPGVLVKYEGQDDWVDAFTVIDGYIIQIHGFHQDFSELTEEENQYALTLLDSVDIVDMNE